MIETIIDQIQIQQYYGFNNLKEMKISLYFYLCILQAQTQSRATWYFAVRSLNSLTYDQLTAKPAITVAEADKAEIPGPFRVR